MTTQNTHATPEHRRHTLLVLVVIAVGALVHPLAAVVLALVLALTGRARKEMLITGAVFLVVTLLMTPTISLGTQYQQSGSAPAKR